MTAGFPSVPLYVLIIYLFIASGASMWLCLHFHEEIYASSKDHQMWFYLSIFLSNNIFAVMAAFLYWVRIEKQEAADVIAAHSCACSLESHYVPNKPYGKLINYFDNSNFVGDEKKQPSLL